MKFTVTPSPIKQDITSVDTVNGRYYITPKGKYPSVTTVLELYTRQAIEEWRQRVGEGVAAFESKRAAKRGSLLHEMLEKYIKGSEVSNLVFQYPMNVVGLFQGLKPVLDANLDNIHLQEKGLYSDTLKVAGRVDCIAEWQGDLAVIDFKGSNKEKKEEWITNYFMQTSAYSYMYWELTGLLPKKIVILVSSEDGAIQVFVKNPADYIRSFKEQVTKFYGTTNSYSN